MSQCLPVAPSLWGSGDPVGLCGVDGAQGGRNGAWRGGRWLPKPPPKHPQTHSLIPITPPLQNTPKSTFPAPKLVGGALQPPRIWAAAPPGGKGEGNPAAAQGAAMQIPVQGTPR